MPIQDVWETRRRRYARWRSREKGEGDHERQRVPKMDLARSRVASSVIQKNRVDEGEKARKTETDEVQKRRKKALRRRRKGADAVECGRGLGLYARRFRVYARVFVYLCGTPENPAETERGRRRGNKKKGRRKRE